jgi:hypothetical protein
MEFLSALSQAWIGTVTVKASITCASDHIERCDTTHGGNVRSTTRVFEKTIVRSGGVRCSGTLENVSFRYMYLVSSLDREFYCLL